MDQRKKIVVGLVVVSIFIFLVSVLVFVYAVSSEGQPLPPFLLPFLEYHIHFMVLMGVFGIFSGLVMYNLLSRTLEKEKKLAQANLGLFMKFLEKEEREAVKLLFSKEGETTQRQIASLPGMTRLKAHRLVRKLEERGIVHVEKEGKVNRVRLQEQLKNELK